MPNILSFDAAIEDAAQYSKRHLLLGNGFSIGCRADIFHYESLFGEANFSEMPQAQRVFNTLGTQDFEVAIKAIENSAKLMPIYVPDAVDVQGTMEQHVAQLKELLVSTISNNHPDTPASIPEEKFMACRRFLTHFLGPDMKGYVFTLNYDLLLYWTVMHDDASFAEEPIRLRRNDGFGNDEDDPEADYVVWQGETGAHDARIYNLHGGLHLFDSGAELQKYTWKRNGTPLVEQSRSAIEDNKFPLFVAEGTSTQKKNKIRHNAYLYQGYKVLTSNAQIGTHCFFIFGHSLAQNDDHILVRLARGKFKKLYVGLFGGINSDANQEIIRRAQEMAAQRQDRFPLEIVFFDSVSANVWGDENT